MFVNTVNQTLIIKPDCSTCNVNIVLTLVVYFTIGIKTRDGQRKDKTIQESGQKSGPFPIQFGSSLHLIKTKQRHLYLKLNLEQNMI